eukprot:scaffold37418_cov30-Tisochrysis_lutea.AAC.2
MRLRARRLPSRSTCHPAAASCCLSLLAHLIVHVIGHGRHEALVFSLERRVVHDPYVLRRHLQRRVQQAGGEEEKDGLQHVVFVDDLQSALGENFLLVGRVVQRPPVLHTALVRRVHLKKVERLVEARVHVARRQKAIPLCPVRDGMIPIAEPRVEVAA